MENQGYIKLHRKMLENPVVSNPNYAWLWIVLLLLANHKDVRMIWNGKEITIKRGQFITSRKKLGVFSGLHTSSVERALETFKNLGQIEQQTNNRFRLITVLKYDDYNKFEQPTNSQRTASEQPANTNNNEKNDNNEKNLFITTPTPSKPIPGETENKLMKWLKGFEKITNPEAYAKKLLEKYPERFIQKAFNSNLCTSPSQLYMLLENFKNKS